MSPELSLEEETGLRWKACGGCLAVGVDCGQQVEVIGLLLPSPCQPSLGRKHPFHIPGLSLWPPEKSGYAACQSICSLSRLL